MTSARVLFAMMLVLLMAGAASAVTVTFQVDMSIQEQMGTFDPMVDSVGVNGSMNGWDIGNPFRLVDPDGDGVFTGDVEGLNDGDYHEYKFVIAPAGDWGNLTWEFVDNRSFNVPAGGGALDVVFFNNVDVLPVDAEVQFLVDMSVMVDAGNFDPANDAVVIRGGHPAIGNWGGYVAMNAIGGDQYELVVPFDGINAGQMIEYKFVVDTGNDQQGPDIWEELPQGGNRSFVVTGDEPDDNNNGYLDVWLDMVYFADNPGGLTSPLNITFVLDGRPAMRKHDDIGIPGVTGDSIDWFIITGPWDGWNWTPNQMGNFNLFDNGNPPDVTAGDSTFTITVTALPGTPINFVYKYGANGGDNEGGFGTNHTIVLPTDQTEITVNDVFGSIDNLYDDYMGEPVIDVTIEELQTNTGAYMDQTVRVTGIVTIPTATVHAGYTDVYVQDDSGYGINLYDGDINASAGMDRGDEVEIVGVVGQYFDTTQLVDFTFTELSAGNDLPDPIVYASTGQFAADAVPMEGSWARLVGTIQDDFSPYDGSYNVNLNSGDGDATVRIWGDTNIDLMDGYAIGDEIVVYGVVDVYSGNPQMMPAMIDDIDMVHNVTIAELQTNTNAYIDQMVHVSGIVTIPTGTVHAGYSDVYIQDDSGYGINLYDGDINATAGMDRGDEYDVVGVLIQYFDTTEITGFTAMELSTGNDLPAPLGFTSTGDFAGTAVPFEGTWAMLEGVIQDDFSPYDGSYNFSINSGDGNATVRIWGDTNIDLMDGYAIGDNIIVHGVVDVYSGNPQMMPAMIDDITSGAQDPVVVTLSPTGDTYVPAGGGTLNFDVNIVSNVPNLYTGVWFFTTVQLPNGNMYPPNLFEFQFNMPPNANLNGNLNQNIPAFAPTGMYTLFGTVAGNTNGNGPHFSGSFDFEKGATAITGMTQITNWDASGSLNLAGEADNVVALPDEFALEAVYPNPFNPMANVTVALPEAAELTVAVYNVMGQQVTELVNGQTAAGLHNFVLDGSHLSSGLYFVQATVPGELNAVQKVTLMK